MKRFILAAACIFPIFVSVLNADDSKVLRIGVSPTSPPIQYWDQNKLAGLEIDFAQKIGEELGRKIELVDLKFRKLIPALISGEIDIIMAGMSITKIREMQISFTTPYLKIGQQPLVRIEDQKIFLEPKDVIMTEKLVGATENTTSEYLLVQEFPNAKKTLFPDQAAAVTALKKKKIDLLVLDSPLVHWLAMKNEGKLATVPFYLTDENLAWGVRKDDKNLLDALNKILAQWKASGQLDAMVDKRIPDYR